MKSLRFQLLLFASYLEHWHKTLFAQAVAEKKLQGGVTGSVGFNFPQNGHQSLLEAEPGFSVLLLVLISPKPPKNHKILLF